MDIQSYTLAPHLLTLSDNKELTSLSKKPTALLHKRLLGWCGSWGIKSVDMVSAPYWLFIFFAPILNMTCSNGFYLSNKK